MIDERYFEWADAQAEAERQAGIERVPKYTDNRTHCRIKGCGEKLPEVRKDIGLCIDCAKDEERILAARKREYADDNGREQLASDLLDLRLPEN